MLLRACSFTVWLIVISVFSGCTPSLSMEPLPSVTVIPASSTPAPTATMMPTTTPLPSSTPTPANQAPSPAHNTTIIFVGETIPDGTNLQPGEKFKKTWTLKNGGNSTWNQGMALVRTSFTPANETLGSPERIPLSKAVEPGAIIDIEVELIAPKQTGQFTVFYQLQNETELPVSDNQFWVTITVGNYPLSDLKSVSAQLVTSSMQGSEFTVDFCMQVPDGRQWYPWGVILLVDQQKFSPSGSRIDPIGATTDYKCFSFSFPVSVASATDYTLEIEKIELPPEVHQAENCAYAQKTLKAVYPGLDFECSGPGAWYSSLVLPPGMTKEQADQLILDAMSSSIYGPWLLNGNAP